jgi:hypothetical protein
MMIPTALIPACPDEGAEVTMNLRSDDSFVEDEGWHRALISPTTQKKRLSSAQFHAEESRFCSLRPHFPFLRFSTLTAFSSVSSLTWR